MAMDNAPSAAENMPNYRVNHWRQDEDQKLIQLVQQHGPQDWNAIAQHIQGRTGKSCRLRWRNHLDPGVNRNSFTKEEEERLIAARRVYGAKWATIAKLFEGRTDNALKNHWHVLIARKRKEAKNGSLKELTKGSSSSSSHDDTLFDTMNFNATQRALAPLCHRDLLSPMNFGSVPSFSDSFPGKESHPFGLLNPAATSVGMMKKGLFHSSSSAFTKFNKGSSSSSDRKEPYDAGFKDVTFYDFLGVGADDE